MKPFAALLCVLLAACAAAPAKEVAPGGTLRVGIGVGPVPSAFWATRDPASGEPRGVTVDLARAMAKDLGVPLQLVAYPNSGEVTNAGPRGEWDVAFMPVDEVRARAGRFRPGVLPHRPAPTWCAAGSSIRTLAEVDQPGVGSPGVEGTTTARSAARSLKNNTGEDLPHCRRVVRADPQRQRRRHRARARIARWHAGEAARLADS